MFLGLGHHTRPCYCTSTGSSPTPTVLFVLIHRLSGILFILLVHRLSGILFILLEAPTGALQENNGCFLVYELGLSLWTIFKSIYSSKRSSCNTTTDTVDSVHTPLSPDLADVMICRHTTIDDLAPTAELNNGEQLKCTTPSYSEMIP